MTPKTLFFRLFVYIKSLLVELVSLKKDTDVGGTINTISQGVELRGANIWILISGAMLASIGLDVSSGAIIIGAMLISPLMSPILGIGLGIGIMDQDLLWKAIKNFSVAVFVSLLASTVYFMLTPLGQLTPELLSRTKPTLLDVGVAIFGGLAGIIANSRKEKSNAIPGVAIATALMPPLCTAGYGIANGSNAIFWGAFYLFFINAVFISLSTYIIVRMLQFPYKKFIDLKVKKKMQVWIAIFSFIVIVPSGIIFWGVIKEANTKRKIESFVSSTISSEKYEAINWELQKGDSVDLVKIFVIGEPIPLEKIKLYDSIFTDSHEERVKLRFIQMNVPEEDRMQMKEEVASEVAMSVMKQVAATKEVINESDMKIDSLLSVIQRLNFSDSEISQIRRESEVVFPEIEAMSFGLLKNELPDSVSTQEHIPMSIIVFKKNYYNKTKTNIQNKFTEYLKLQLRTDSVYVIAK